MASLGLSRIANSLVGDATKRGVSGGEKKRVNIGIELMKQPKILFLDEVRSFELYIDRIDYGVLTLAYHYCPIADQWPGFKECICCHGESTTPMPARNDRW